MTMNMIYLTLLSPLHTGGTTQEGNLLGIARESHTNLPYIPSSTIRGRLRANVLDQEKKFALFGNEIADGVQLEQGSIWIGDGSLLWIPVSSLSHGVVWITCPLLLKRWIRASGQKVSSVPSEYSTSLGTDKPIYLKDAILRDGLKPWEGWKDFVKDPNIERVIVLPDQHCATLIQMSLWRQVKVKLDEHKVVDGGFRYEEAIPPDSLMYFTWGVTAKANGTSKKALSDFQELLTPDHVMQIGGQESLGRGFVQIFSDKKDPEIS
ncbi:MAG: type III-B CRISPR module RAMP protein Cmr4 [Synechococcaceae cyanobacterium SM2_3_2]|nr:type III-B CRISPR module RAMP protein Cmr4 [Synechococcaceae cyanobacterium SM2_3_2]